MKKLIEIHEKYHYIIIISFFLSFFFSDFITNTLDMYYPYVFRRYSAIFKFVFEIYLLAVFFTKRDNYLTFYLGSILACFVIGQIFLQRVFSFHDIYTNIITGDFYRVNCYLYILLFINLIENLVEKKVVINLIEIFRVILYINGALIFSGLLFDIELFKSYPFSERFGFDGIFSKSGEATFLYLLLISLEYIKYVRTGKKFYLMISIFVSFFLGLKTVILFLFLLLLSHLIYKKRNRIRNLSIFTVVTVILFMIRHKIMLFMISIFPFWENIFYEQGLITTLTSERNILFLNGLDFIKSNWSIANYLFGGVINYEKIRVEFEVVDLFLFFGLFGILIFFSFFKHFFWKKQDFIGRCVLIVMLFSLNAKGGGLMSILGMICFYLVFKYVSITKEQTHSI